jgi:peptidoglycan/LPS O-acetylase OafA/YrhL
VGLLEARWLAGLGRISYGFYLYHNLIPDLTRNHRAQALFGGAVPLWAHTLGIAASFGISLGLALLSWRLIEEPILRLKTRRVSVDNAKSVAPQHDKRGARVLTDDDAASEVA